MKWIEVKIVFDAPDQDLAREVISNLLFESELQGIVEEDPSLEPAEGWPEDSIGRARQNALIGYLLLVGHSTGTTGDSANHIRYELLLPSDSEDVGACRAREERSQPISPFRAPVRYGKTIIRWL